jgi:hypothetical protein
MSDAPRVTVAGGGLVPSANSPIQLTPTRNAVAEPTREPVASMRGTVRRLKDPGGHRRPGQARG